MYLPAAIRYLIIALAGLALLAACRREPPRRRHTAAAAGAHHPVRPPDPKSDGSYEAFLDSILSREDIGYADSAVEAEEVWLWSEQDGPYPKSPKTFRFGDREFPMRRMEVVNEDGDRLMHIRYDVDTAYRFRFRDRDYGWAIAHYYGCNGTGCMERYYLLADFSRGRLHVFRTMAVPDYHDYFGDLNGDDQLDVLIPDYFFTEHSGLPYSDTTELISFTPYTLNTKGRFETIRNDKKDCLVIGQFDGGNFAPARFRLIGSTCMMHGLPY
jgi:hypothetical protein